MTTSDPLRVDAILGIYWEEHAQNTASWADIQRTMTHLAEHFGHLLPHSVRQTHANSYIEKRGIGAGSVRGELVVLRTAINWAINSGYILPLHRRLYKVPSPPRPKERWLRDEEVDRLLAAGREARTHRMGRAERFAWIGLETGARRRSIETLTWDRVDLDQGKIDFRTPGKKQTNKVQTVAPISARLRPILELAYRERCSNFVLDTSSDVYKSFTTLCKRAEIEGVTPHTLRHTCATRLLRRGVPVEQIAALIGSSVAMIHKVYGHVSWEDLVAAVGG